MFVVWIKGNKKIDKEFNHDTFLQETNTPPKNTFEIGGQYNSEPKISVPAYYNEKMEKIRGKMFFTKGKCEKYLGIKKDGPLFYFLLN